MPGMLGTRRVQVQTTLRGNTRRSSHWISATDYYPSVEPHVMKLFFGRGKDQPITAQRRNHRALATAERQGR
jgi:hypothetical protein